MQYRANDLPEVTVGRLVGRARALDDRRVISPVTGTPCLVYRVKVMLESGGQTTELVEETLGVKFALDDDTGSVIVDPDGARCSLTRDRHSQGVLNTWDDLTPGQAAFLEAHGFHRSPRILGIRWHEGVVEVDETIAVVGFGHRDAAGVLTMSSSPHLPLTITDEHVATRRLPLEIPGARVV